MSTHTPARAQRQGACAHSLVGGGRDDVLWQAMGASASCPPPTPFPSSPLHLTWCAFRALASLLSMDLAAAEAEQFVDALNKKSPDLSKLSDSERRERERQERKERERREQRARQVRAQVL